MLDCFLRVSIMFCNVIDESARRLTNQTLLCLKVCVNVRSLYWILSKTVCFCVMDSANIKKPHFSKNVALNKNCNEHVFSLKAASPAHAKICRQRMSSTHFFHPAKKLLRFIWLDVEAIIVFPQECVAVGWYPRVGSFPLVKLLLLIRIKIRFAHNKCFYSHKWTVCCTTMCKRFCSWRFSCAASFSSSLVNVFSLTVQNLEVDIKS